MNTCDLVNFELTDFIKHELVLVFLEELGASVLVQEQGVNAFDVFDSDFRSFAFAGDETRRRYQLDRVPQRRFGSDACQDE